jgi:hypothetical protein
VQEAMLLTSPHVHRFVDEIHLVLMETVRGGEEREGGGSLALACGAGAGREGKPGLGSAG